MSDLIDRQAAIDSIQCAGKIGKQTCISILKRLPSVQPEQRWIPVSLGLPPDLEPVNVTWINRDPEPYYVDIKDKPFTATAVYCYGKWYWWSATCPDMLSEYGRNEIDEVDENIDIIAWMPLPEPWAERRVDEQIRCRTNL